MDSVRVVERFVSLQGESHWAGYPCAFVRLAGCNLDCGYCDTRYARESRGEETSVAELAAWAAAERAPLVEVTGGEPLAQEGTPALLAALAATGARVLLETNGSLPLTPLAGIDRLHVILDVKTPGSGMADRNHWENLDRLRASDEIKVVLTGREDYAWAVRELTRRRAMGRLRVSFSPVWGALPPADLAAWLVADRLPVRFQLQLHRLLWPTRDRGV